ncbi:hypothetical protein A3765_00980 [Oleiphilus sp. HI0130]|nr:hypothetical protein A3765_00980 [Oleiphilus sp. HI0130]
MRKVVKNNDGKLLKFRFICLQISGLLMLLCAALVSSHYSEPFLTPVLKNVKFYILTGGEGRFKASNDLVPYTNYPFLDRPVINPAHVAQQVLFDSENYLLKRHFPAFYSYGYNPNKGINKHKIINVADWIIDTYPMEKIRDKSVIRLAYEFDYPEYDLQNPWYSSLAQAYSIFALLAAYELTEEQKYISSAEMLGATLTLPIDAGGTLLRFNNNSVWHEEYADSTKSSHPLVLNGNNYAIDSLFWLSVVSGQDIWRGVLVDSLHGLDENIVRYQTIFWSRYDLIRNFAHWGYHDLHISQLEKITKIYAPQFGTELSTTESVLDSFRVYQYIPFGFTERLLMQGNNLLIAILLINFFGFLGVAVLVAIYKTKRLHSSIQKDL